MLDRISSLVARVILENTGRQVTPEPDDSLIGSGHLDSMTMVNLVIAIQSEFGVVLDMTDMSVENFDSVTRIANLVSSRCA